MLDNNKWDKINLATTTSVLVKIDHTLFVGICLCISSFKNKLLWDYWVAFRYHLNVMRPNYYCSLMYVLKPQAAFVWSFEMELHE